MVYPSSARTHLQAFSPISRSDLTNITKTKTKTKTFTTLNLINFVLFLFLDLRFLLDVLVMWVTLLWIPCSLSAAGAFILLLYKYDSVSNTPSWSIATRKQFPCFPINRVEINGVIILLI